MSADPSNDNLHSERNDAEKGPEAGQGEWSLWPPSPKMQIALIAAAFGLFNFLLLAIWAIVMIKQF
jgi:hypothetical protein